METKEMKSINIKGKEYIPVHERVMYFRENYKDWSIKTEIVQFDSEIAAMKAIIVDENGMIRATGHAYELQTDKTSFVNKTSYLENCETSAIGRALGCLGIGIENSFASANEVKSAMENDKNPDLEKPWLSENQFNLIIQRLRSGEFGEGIETAKELVDKTKEKFRMKKTYLESLEFELNDDFSKKMNE